ncbi:MAG: hypothetical protein RLZZ70_629, partial [Candidatus Parcubacteria bacterium]
MLCYTIGMHIRSVVYQLGKRYIIPGILAVALLLTLVTVSWDANVAVEAQLANYFASTCTGGWENPAAASGRPDVSGEGYTPDNAAVFLDNAAEIECLSFTGELPPLTYHTEASIRFSWSQPGRVMASVEDVVLDELPEVNETATNTTDVENSGGTDSAMSSTTESGSITNDGAVADV